jgi:hypothetical protein
MLPSTFGSSVWFDEDELAELEGTTLHRATVMQVGQCKLLPSLLRYIGHWNVCNCWNEHNGYVVSEEVFTKIVQ